MIGDSDDRPSLQKPPMRRIGPVSRFECRCSSLYGVKAGREETLGPLQKPSSGQVNVRKSKVHNEPMCILGNAAITNFHEAEYSLDDLEDALYARAHSRLRPISRAFVRLADPVLTTDVLGARACLLLFEDADDLDFSEPGFLTGRSLSRRSPQDSAHIAGALRGLPVNSNVELSMLIRRRDVPR